MFFGTGICKCGDNAVGWIRESRGGDEGVKGKEIPENGVRIGEDRWKAQKWRHGEKGDGDARGNGGGLFLG